MRGLRLAVEHVDAAPVDGDVGEDAVAAHVPPRVVLRGAQHAASELTRRKLRRRTDDNHRQRELNEPLPKLVAERAAKRKTGERIGAYRAANDQGRAAVMDELDRFDRLRGTLGTAPDAKL